MKAGAIELAWIVVSDLNKAIEYYTDVVGLKLIEHHGEYGWAEFQSTAGGARLGLAQANKEYGMLPGKNAVITINVDHIEEARDALINKGATILGSIMEVPGHVRLQLLADPDGNHLQIAQLLYRN